MKFKNKNHQAIFNSESQRLNRNDNVKMSVLYLLTADVRLWNAAKPHIRKGSIDLDNIDVSVWNDPDDADSYHSWSSEGRWAMFGTRRLDGRYTRIYIAYLDEDGRPHKPFLLPQEDPRHNGWRLVSYNIPEFRKGKVELPKEAADMFYSED